VPDGLEISDFKWLLRRYRLTAGLTQAELARRAGLSERAIQDLERGISRPRRQTADRLVAALGAPPGACRQFEAATLAPRRARGRKGVGSELEDEAGRGDTPAMLPARMSSTGDDRPTRPAPITSFVGRERELADIVRLMQTHRLVTLTGPGGCGKTRLALEAVACLAAPPSREIFVVMLASLAESTLVTSAVAEALEVREASDRALLETVVSVIGERNVLLVLDNFEHLLPAAPLVINLLAACPNLRVLTTSREVLRLGGEQVYVVAPLSLPKTQSDSGEAREPVSAYGESEAVQLFVARAQSADSTFQLDAVNVTAVAEICERLDGLPLAIELAAARIRHMTVDALRARIEHRLHWLTHGPRDGPARQQTLRDAIAWSYDLLEDPERRLFRRLAIFAGGCTFDAADAVANAGGDLGGSSHELVSSLVDKSLLRPDVGPDGEPRFTMLETIREYAAEQLKLAGEQTTIRRRHLRWCVHLSERVCAEIYGPDAAAWLRRLTVEYDNVRAALAWSLEDEACASGEDGLRLAASLLAFWYIRDHLSEGRRWLEQVIARNGTPTPPAGERSSPMAGRHQEKASSVTLSHDPVRRHQWGRAPRIVALNGLALLAANQQDLAAAESACQEAMELARRYGDEVGYAYALGSLAQCVRTRGDPQSSLALAEEALARFRGTGDPAGTWRAVTDLGQEMGARGELDRAQGFHQESLDIARSLGSPWQVAAALNRLGRVAYARGDLDRASTLVEESVSQWRPVDATRGLHLALATLGDIALKRGDARQAAARFQESLTLCQRAGDRAGVARALEGLASVWSACSRSESGDGALRAAMLFGAAEAAREAIWPPLEPDEEAARRRAIGATRAALGAAAFEVAWARGQTMDIVQAIAHVQSIELPLQSSDDMTGPTRLEQQARLLTAREREIVALLGRSRTNRQIAEELVTSERTIETHTRNIRDKLGLETRAQLIAWAVEQRLATARD
jgi:predicted ATPase/DNA-binding CsgD family transcriptional regulator/transcriptional regulator with XRE-family HTH domain